MATMYTAEKMIDSPVAPCWLGYDKSVKVLPPGSFPTCSCHCPGRNHPANYTNVESLYLLCAPTTPSVSVIHDLLTPVAVTVISMLISNPHHAYRY